MTPLTRPENTGIKKKKEEGLGSIDSLEAKRKNVEGKENFTIYRKKLRRPQSQKKQK